MKRLIALLLVIALMLPAVAMAEATFSYMHLLENSPIQAYGANRIPFVILTNDPSTINSANRNAFGSDRIDLVNQIERYASVYCWNASKNRFTELLEPIVEGVTGYNYNGAVVDNFYPKSMSGYVSFPYYGKQYVGYVKLTCEKYVLTSDQYYGLSAPSAVVRAVEEARSSTNGSEYEIARYLHDWLCDWIDYSDNAVPSGDTYQEFYHSSGISGLMTRYGKCTSYAHAYVLLLRTAGIDAFCVDGQAVSGGRTGGHMWNIVRLDGRWCFVDVTWDDTDRTGRYSYDYFAVSKDVMDRNHTPNSESEAFCNFLMDGRFDQAVRNFGK